MLLTSMVFKKFYKGVFFAFLLISCQQEKGNIYFVRGEAQGSTYAIKYISDSERISQKEVDSLLDAFDLSLSTYKSNSKISRINSGDSTVVLDDWMVKTYLVSERIFKETQGLFDPTVGVLVNAYGFGPSKQRKFLTERDRDSLLTFVGFDKVKMTDDRRIIKMYPEIYFDFNAIAQGYSVDVLSEFLQTRGIENFIVEVGGEIVAKGINIHEEKPWIIGIDDPLQKSNERKLIAKIKVRDLGMATSGNYRKVIEDSVTGQKYVHTIHPKTGLPKKGNILSATVLTSECIDADGYATAFMVMDLNDIKSFLMNKKDLYVMLVYSDDVGEIQRFETENFKDLLID